MKYCKKVCQTLKVVSKQIADANEIPYEITECHHEGDCRGTCPKCESEVRYIENQLNIRRAAGKAVSLVGLSLGISTAFTSCSTKPDPHEELIETEEEVLGGSAQIAPEESSALKYSIYPDYDTEGIIEAGEDMPLIDLSTDEGPYEGEEPEEDQIFTIVEQQPEFPGGEAALTEYIKKNIRYSVIASESAIIGRVTLSFIIEKDGSISNIEVMRSPAEECSYEAIRVVKSMPKWKPGKQRGKTVRVKCVLPITFRLE